MNGEVALPNLNGLGSASIFARENDESSTTWAIDKLKKLGISFSDPIVNVNITTHTSNFTNSEEYHRQNSPVERDLL